jgi:1-deoxy-D-xylulose-5-phosphate synthase
MTYEILDKINSPDDLRVIPKSDMSKLADEIRAFLVDITNKNGGHLASNLGVVEITLAIHRVFNSPKDHIVFDVGHQSYVHKLLTGRREMFDTLRQPGGLSGFPSIRESEHDAFGTGHSSTSISASVGLAIADKLQGKDAFSVCVIGDGAFTGGMVHEALNNVTPDLPLIIILNENGMAISKNRGLFADYISAYRSSHKYKAFKGTGREIARSLPVIGTPIIKLASRIKNKIKNIFYSPSYFEKMGFEYLGPIDGHDMEKLENALRMAKSLKKPVIIHTKTTKGKGYTEAEEAPREYHSVQTSKSDDSFSLAFVNELISVAESDESICAITPAMAKGTELYRFGEKFPSRYFDTGIAEAHALTFGAALAKSGMKPFVATYSTFLQRGYDNIIHDIALQNLPVKIVIDRAGLAVSDGATHHGIFDVSYLSGVPGITIFAPASYSSLKNITHIAAEAKYPVAIRYSGSESKVAYDGFFKLARPVGFGISQDFDMSSPPDYVFVTYGKILDSVIEAAEFMRAKGLSVGIILTEIIKPYNHLSDVIMKLNNKAKRILYVEEGIENGGAAVLTMNSLRKLGFDFSSTEYRIAAIDDDFLSPTRPADLYDLAGLTPKKLVEKMIL